jgi:nucleotide-binding universal stress UspA family protein
MKKILFPTDFSEVATNAFVHALHFANIVNGELVLLHTYEVPIYDSQFFPQNYSTIYDSVQLAEFDMFKEEVHKLRKIAEKQHLDKIKMSHRLVDGGLMVNIKQAIKEEKIDFVIMGTSGATGWAEFFVNSNTGTVITRVDIPVLSIPLEAKFNKIQTIGFTTNFNNKDKKALATLLEIVYKTKSTIKCLHVKTSTSTILDATIKEWQTEFKSEPIQFSIIPSDEVKETILEFINYKHIDILAMVNFKRNFFVDLFNPSLTKKIANHSNVPVLALHVE